MSDRIFERVIAELHGEGYFFQRRQNDRGQDYIISRADIEAGDIKYECDTVIEFEKGGIFRPTRFIFSTFIYSALAGEEAAKFYSVIDVLNYHYPGKFVLEQPGESNSIYYITIERRKRWGNTEVIIDNLEHHASVKASIKPEFDKLRDDLRLTTRTLPPPESLFANKWYDAFTHKLLGNKGDI